MMMSGDDPNEAFMQKHRLPSQTSTGTTDPGNVTGTPGIPSIPNGAQGAASMGDAAPKKSGSMPGAKSLSRGRTTPPASGVRQMPSTSGRQGSSGSGSGRSGIGNATPAPSQMGAAPGRGSGRVSTSRGSGGAGQGSAKVSSGRGSGRGSRR